MHIGLTQQSDKLVFVGMRPKLPVIARPVRTLVVAIPRLEKKCTEKRPGKWELPLFLAAIVTWLRSTGGLPHQCAHLLRNDSVYSPNTNLPGY